MKYCLIISIVLYIWGGSLKSYSQTVLFYEDFETPPYQLTASGSPAWAVNDSIAYNGNNSYHNTVGFHDTSYIHTHTFSTQSYPYVLLSFAQICKVNIFDGAYVEVSSDGGTSWSRLSGQEYLGHGQYGSLGNRFTAASYPALWEVSNSTAVPDNSWWTYEMFDISYLAGDKAAVQIRFVLYDGGNPPGQAGHYGWLIDAIQIKGNSSELNPPQIAYNSPVLQDTLWGTGPFQVSAEISDSSGVMSAYLFYALNGATADSIAMTNTTGDTYTATIPQLPYNTAVAYYIKATDSAPAGNTAKSLTKNFYNTKTPSEVVIGTSSFVALSSLYSPLPRLSATSAFRYTASNKIYTASELQAAGIFPQTKIDAIAYNKYSAEGTIAGKPLKLEVLMANTNNKPPLPLTTSVADIQSSHTLVYSNPSHDIPQQSGWTEINLTTPFVYTGGSLEIAVFSEISGNSPYSTGRFDWVYSDNRSDYVTGVMSETQLHGASQLLMKSALRKQRPNIKFFIDTTTYLNDAGIVHLSAGTDVVSTLSPENVYAVIRNYGATPLNNAEVSFAVNGNWQADYNWSGFLYEGMSSDTIIPGSVLFNAGYNTVKAWTNAPNNSPDNNNLNDTLTLSVYGCAGPLSGHYYVGGPGADYPSLNAIVKDMEKCGINGHVVVNLMPGIFEERLILTDKINTSPTQTVTFRGSSSSILTYTPEAQNKSAVIALEGASHFRFDSLSIILPDTVLWGAGFYIGNNCKDIVIGHCHIHLNEVSSNSHLYGILVSGDPGSNTASSKDIKDLLINSNTIKGGYIGISLKGSDSSHIENVFLSNNNIKTSFRSGIVFNNTESLTARHNNIEMRPVTEMGSRGIDGSVSAGPFDISNNIISHAGYIGISLSTVQTSSGSYSVLSNNVIGGSYKDGTSVTYGIYINNSTNIKVLHNSINCNDTHGAGLHVTAYSSGITLLNNAFVYAGTGPGYAAQIDAPASIVASDFNNYYSGQSPNFVYYGTAIDNLTVLQSLNTPPGNDQNSVSGAPYFYSDTWLKPMGAILYKAGTFVAAIPEDIEGVLRDTTAPSIGAYEQLPHDNDAALIAIVTPKSGCSLTSSETISLEVLNAGLLPITNFDMAFTIDSGNTVTESFTGNINFGERAVFSFNTTADFGLKTNYNIFANVMLSGDQEPFNDTLSYVLKTGHDFSTGNYRMGFEKDEDWQLWHVIDGNNDGMGWQPGFQSAIYARTGTGSAMYNQGLHSTGDDWLVTKCFELDSGLFYIVEFWYRANSDLHPQNLSFMVGDDTSPSAFTDTLITLNNFTNTTYQRAYTVISPQENAVYYFAWYSDASHTCYIDDFKISVTQNTTDIGITEIMAPDSITVPNTPTYVSAVVKNFGAQPVSHFDVVYDINHWSPVTHVFTDTISPGEEVTVNFLQPYISPFGAYVLCVEAFLANDQDSTNNRLCSIHYGAILTGTSINKKDSPVLYQNIPNPARASTRIDYYIPRDGLVLFTLTDIYGRALYTREKHQHSGKHTINITTDDLAAGIYFYSIYYEGQRQTKRLVVF